MNYEIPHPSKNHGISSLTCPGLITLITPAHIHINFDVLFKAGTLASKTVGDPVTQGPGITGTQGIGVNTPIAAAVAEATVGFAKDIHIPKGRIFTIGLLSIMLAAGIAEVNTRFTGRTTNELGAIPKLHLSIAPEHTWRPINYPLHKSLLN
jgi:hypothetical protein